MEPNGPSSPGPSRKLAETLASSSTTPPGSSALPVVPFYASIRFSSSSSTDLEVTIPNVNASPLPTVLEIKNQIRFLRPSETYHRRLRLILSGKVLNDHTPLKVIQRQQSRRPSIIAPPPSVKGKEKEGVPVDRIWIHCSMGEQLSDKEYEQEERESQSQPTTQSTLPLPVGFDRLRSAGFSDDDIASLRSQFQRFHGARGDNDEEVDVTAMEERWLDETIGLGGGGTTGDGGLFLL